MVVVKPFIIVITSPGSARKKQCRSRLSASTMFPRYIVHEGNISVEAVDGSKGVVDHTRCALAFVDAYSTGLAPRSVARIVSCTGVVVKHGHAFDKPRLLDSIARELIPAVLEGIFPRMRRRD